MSPEAESIMTGRVPRLFLIDGSSYIYRAFFALPPAINSAGCPTNATFGFISFMMKLLKRHQPEYLVVALDAGRQTFRSQMFVEYKSNRRQAPPDLVRQLPYIRRVLDAMNIVVLELQDYEADDLIGTLCATLCEEDCDLIVISSDKDLMQLISDKVSLFDSIKERWIGAREVIAKFGVEPERVPEVLGLMGDVVDNIPGVKGVGQKTAIALMQQFHDLEDLYGNLDRLQQSNLRGLARLREALQNGKETAFLSRGLATIKKNVPMQIDLQELRFNGPGRDKMRSLFEELEFNNLIKLLDHGHGFTRDLGLVTLPQKPLPKTTLSVQLPLFSWK
jgi:5'-3' exonuclease